MRIGPIIKGIINKIRNWCIKKRNLYSIRVVMKLIPKTSLRNNQLHFHLFQIERDIMEGRRTP
jgi:hypothetical protein